MVEDEVMPGIEQDYVMRMIAELAAFLRRVRDLVRLGRAQDALDAIRDGCQALVGMDARVLELLDARTLFGQLAPGKAGAAAALFAAQGDAWDSLGEPERARGARRRALELYLEMQLAGAPPDAAGVATARELLARFETRTLDGRQQRAAALLRGE